MGGPKLFSYNHGPFLHPQITEKLYKDICLGKAGVFKNLRIRGEGQI